jgi:excisionase family DNA binding protein
MKKETKAKLLPSIGEASQILGVSEATLRQWTDDGLIKAYVTPGGHRRYAREQLDEFMHSHQKMLGTKDLVARLEDTAEPLREIGATTSVGAYKRLGPAQQKNLAILGRKILNAIICYVSEPAKREESLSQARETGAEFGTILAEARVPLTDSIQVFTSHRAPIIESVATMMRQREVVTESILAAIPLIDDVMDQALVELVKAYQAKARS